MAGPGAPGANSRGRGGKFRKFTRGGGKHFSRDLKPLDVNGNEISMWSEDAQKQFANSDENSSEEDSEEESSEDDGPANGVVSREDRKKEKKARKDAAIAKKKAGAVEVGDMPSSDDDEESDNDMPANPNHSKAARSQTKVKMSGDVDEAADRVKDMTVSSRKDRESAEAALAKEKYMRLHEAGKTDQAKADLARLKLIREQRAAEAERRQAEKEEKEAQEATRKAEIEAKEAKKRAAAMGPAKKGKKAK